MPDAAPLRLLTTPIKPEWLDYNDHLNVAYYVLIFDMAGVALFDHLGMGEAYSRETGGSWVVLESHITYDREVMPSDVVTVETRLIDHDAKRL
ncbi:MAG: acyl-CoA thioesterase, partial [Rhodospirillaceae bacterium]|nr:acyl-CoA thioesterase [Rhodospirillaceae bacterium]